MSTEAFWSLVTSWTTSLLLFKRSSQSVGNIFRISKLEYGWLLIIWKNLLINYNECMQKWQHFLGPHWTFSRWSPPSKVNRMGKGYLSVFTNMLLKTTKSPNFWAHKTDWGYLANLLPIEVVKNFFFCFILLEFESLFNMGSWKVYSSGRHRSGVSPLPSY